MHPNWLTRRGLVLPGESHASPVWRTCACMLFVYTPNILRSCLEQGRGQCFATDISPTAAETTKRTLRAHGVDAEVVHFLRCFGCLYFCILVRFSTCIAAQRDA